MFYGVLCGWRIASEMPLPEISPGADDGTPADLSIRLGDTPADLPDPRFRGPLTQIGSDGAYLYSFPGVARYWVDPDGKSVTITPHAKTDLTQVRLFLFGTVLAVLCHHRGILPLHASCIRVDTPDGPRAIAFAGPSGMGKSTLAAELRRQGYTILADDITALRLDDQGRAVVLPALPRLKLWRSSLHYLHQSPDQLERVRDQLEKYLLPIDNGFSTHPIALTAIVHLARTNDPERQELVKLQGLKAALQFAANIYRDRLLARLSGNKRAQLQHSAKLAAAVPKHRLWTRVMDFADLPTAASGLIGQIMEADGE